MSKGRELPECGCVRCHKVVPYKKQRKCCPHCGFYIIFEGMIMPSTRDDIRFVWLPLSSWLKPWTWVRRGRWVCVSDFFEQKTKKEKR